MLSSHDVLAARTTTFPRQEGPNKPVQQAKVFVKSSYDTTFEFAFKKVFASQKVDQILVTFVCF